MSYMRTGRTAMRRNAQTQTPARKDSQTTKTALKREQARTHTRKCVKRHTRQQDDALSALTSSNLK